MTIVADSNLIIASVVKTHGFHARATAAPLQAGELLIPQHVLFESFSVLTRERDIRTAGGRLYDAIIAVAAIEAGAQRIMTFNPKHFETFGDRIEIVVPS